MKTIAITRHGTPQRAFELREEPRPRLRAGQALIKVDAFGLNFADVLARQGSYREAPKVPFVPGYEVVGHVAELGPLAVRPDPVTAARPPRRHAPDCGALPGGEFPYQGARGGAVELKVGQRVVAFTRFGGYAEYALTDHRTVQPIPGEMSNGVAAALATQYCTAYYASSVVTNLLPGERVLVHAAAGGVGTALVQLAKLRGCVVFGTAGSDQKMEYLRRIGVDHPINYRSADFAVEIRRLLMGGTLDAAFDSLGGKTYRRSYSLLGAGGRMVSYGVAELSGRYAAFRALRAAFGFGLLHPIALILRSRAAIGVNMLVLSDSKPEVLGRCLANVVQLANEGKLSPQTGRVFKAEQIAEAHAYLESRASTGKIVVEW